MVGMCQWLQGASIQVAYKLARWRRLEECVSPMGVGLTSGPTLARRSDLRSDLMHPRGACNS